jgi:hypothetical protein
MASVGQSDLQLESAVEQKINLEKADLEIHPVLDKYGFPLVPQPTSHTDDPLVSEDGIAHYEHHIN